MGTWLSGLLLGPVLPLCFLGPGYGQLPMLLQSSAPDSDLPWTQKEVSEEWESSLSSEHTGPATCGGDQGRGWDKQDSEAIEQNVSFRPSVLAQLFLCLVTAGVTRGRRIKGILNVPMHWYPLLVPPPCA